MSISRSLRADKGWFLSGFVRSIADGKYFTKDHEWIKVEDGTATIGITDFAQHALGDVVYVDLPEKGESLKKKGCVAGLESVKAASDVFTPLSGKITDVNTKLEDDAALINKSAEGSGWVAKIKLDPSQEDSTLMNSSAYEEYIKTAEH